MKKEMQYKSFSFYVIPHSLAYVKTKCNDYTSKSFCRNDAETPLLGVDGTGRFVGGGGEISIAFRRDGIFGKVVLASFESDMMIGFGFDVTRTLLRSFAFLKNAASFAAARLPEKAVLARQYCIYVASRRALRISSSEHFHSFINKWVRRSAAKWNSFFVRRGPRTKCS